MKANFSLSIPNPCSEDWNSFTPTKTGGFCSSCQKNVVDFTKATDDEIIAFLTRIPKHACGRFRSDQLKTYRIIPEVKIRPGFMLLKAGVISLLLLLIGKPGSAQTASLKTTTEIVQHKADSRISKEILIKGVVRMAEDSTAVSGVSIVQRGTIHGTFTSDDGRFQLRFDPAKGNIVVFSFISLETQELTITGDTLNMTVMMKTDTTSSLRGEVVVIAGMLGQPRDLNAQYTYPESAWKRFWRKIGNWF